MELLEGEKDPFELTDEACECDNEEEPEKEDETTYKEGWVKTENGWKYRLSDGSFVTSWQVIDGERYYFDENGIMLTGWHEIDDVWYYFSESGVLRK